MLARTFKNVRDGLIALAYPQDCRVCGSIIESWDDGVACARCWDDLEVTQFFTNPLCAKCGLPMRSAARSFDLNNDGVSETAAGEQSCGKCASLPFSAARACGAYSGAIEASVLFLKSQPHLCSRLRQVLLRTFSEHQALIASDVVIAVPLHRLRERERGFNQARIIAQAISKEFRLPVDNRSLARVKYTEMHRAGMDELDRAKSVERAFKVKRPEFIKGASVLVVDDLYTTGSTMRAAAEALLEGGATRVSVFTIARVASSFGHT